MFSSFLRKKWKPDSNDTGWDFILLHLLQERVEDTKARSWRTKSGDGDFNSRKPRKACALVQETSLFQNSFCSVGFVAFCLFSGGIDWYHKSLSSAVKSWTHFFKEKKLNRFKEPLNIMRSTKARYSCSFPAVKRLQGNRKCQSLKEKFHLRTFSFEVPGIHSKLPGDLAETPTHLQWKYPRAAERKYCGKCIF